MKKGFTLAEVLITLAIIGVVAAITIPIIIHNYNKQNTVAKLKVAYELLANTIQTAEAKNGSAGSEDYLFQYDSSNSDDIESENNKIDEFTNNYLIPYMNVSDSGRKPLEDFGYKNGIFKPNGSVKYLSDSPQQGILLPNGMFIMISLGQHATGGTSAWKTHLVFDVDIDGPNHGANALGKDIFRFQKYFSSDSNLSKVTPFGLYNSVFNYETRTFRYSFYSRDKLLQSCGNGGTLCAALIIIDGWKIADDYPWL